MEITKLIIKKILPTEKGLVGFVSFVIDDCLYLGEIAIFTRLNQNSYRLVFPEKRKGDRLIPYFYPLTSEFYFQLEKAVNKKFNL